MSKSLELVQRAPIATTWPYIREMADRLSQQKRLTGAELAAEYYRAAFLHENAVAENDGYDGAPDVREHRRQTSVLHRFATLPHYDEPQP